MKETRVNEFVLVLDQNLAHSRSTNKKPHCCSNLKDWLFTRSLKKRHNHSEDVTFCSTIPRISRAILFWIISVCFLLLTTELSVQGQLRGNISNTRDNFKGHNISLSRCASLLFFQYTMYNKLSVVNLYRLFSFLLNNSTVLFSFFNLYLLNYVTFRDWRNK